MSKGIPYDPLLVRYLARELDRHLRGRACVAAPLFAPDLSALLPVEGGAALRLDLHPDRGWIRLVDWNGDRAELDAVCEGVEAPVDERVLVFQLRAVDRFRAFARRLVVELPTNQWNALLVSEEDARILSALRARNAGDRSLYPGAEYRPPPAPGRYGAGPVEREEAASRWAAEVGGAEPAQRRTVLLRGFAFVGAPNVDAILGTASERDEELAAAFARWWELRSLPKADPVLLTLDDRPLPYPVPLPGRASEPVESLLAGMVRVAEWTAPSSPAETEREVLRRRIRQRADAAARKVQRLEEQLRSAGEAERMRGWADLLLAHLHRVPRGAEAVELPGWEGDVVRVPLDPGLTPAENAARWYAQARRRARADERIPELLEAARADRARWEEAVAAAEAGELPQWVTGELEAERGTGEPGARAGAAAPARPFRVYRTSGGLEVRVGRSARDNDRLTFGHSSPNDVWLHARSVPGSHVVLRWSDAQSSPPARDLEEAAALAALFSRARTSAVVPVDWTRRKYVRKPRGAPPGKVVIQRARTLFVAPDASLEERLRSD